VLSTTSFHLGDTRYLLTFNTVAAFSIGHTGRGSMGVVAEDFQCQNFTSSESLLLDDYGPVARHCMHLLLIILSQSTSQSADLDFT